MTKKYFVSLDLTEKDLVEQIVPHAQKYGLERVIGLSDNFDTDIEGINSAQAFLNGFMLKGVKVLTKYNRKYFPHLSSGHVFSNVADVPTHDDTKMALIGEHFMLQHTGFFNEGDESLGQIVVCERPTQTSLEEVIQKTSEPDYFFTREKTVSSHYVLN